MKRCRIDTLQGSLHEAERQTKGEDLTVRETFELEPLEDEEEFEGEAEAAAEES